MRRLTTLIAALALSIGLVPADAAPRHVATTEVIDVLGVLVHLAPEADMEAGMRGARERGLVIGARYPQIGVFVAYGPRSAMRRLEDSDPVDYLEENAPLQYLTDTSHRATRGESVLDGEVTLPDETVIDGTGVGVAIVDTGVDGTHPDLEDRMVDNLRIYCLPPQVPSEDPCEFVPLDDTDHPSGSGHGTHVAGTVAGTGLASERRFHGAAPGVGLYGLGAGTVSSITAAVAAFDWVLENHDKVDPPIRVVNNSWATGMSKPNPSNPSAITKMQMEMLDAGITVVFAAGNSGGGGSEQRTSTQCVLLTPGNICVANYDDKQTGTQQGSVSSGSSRGDTGDPETWPDLSAPGTGITATCRLTLPSCSSSRDHELDPPNHYSASSGTSMAAPHVTGIVALLYEADPGLRPGEVEWVLKETAHKFTFASPYRDDPLHPGGTSSYDKGHGLVDALAAVEAVLDPLVVSSPEGGATVGSSVDVSGRIWYGDTIEIAVDGTTITTLENVVRFWSHAVGGLQPGRHTITATLSSDGRVVGSVERVITAS